jgi:hypothetical protein
MNRTAPQVQMPTQCPHSPGQRRAICEMVRIAALSTPRRHIDPMMANHGNEPFARNLAATFTVYLLEERTRGWRPPGAPIDRQKPPYGDREGKLAVSHRLQGTTTNRPPKSPDPQIFCPSKNSARQKSGAFNFEGSNSSALRSSTLSDTFAPMSDQTEQTLSVRVPADLREALERAAEQEHRTLSGQLRWIIAHAVKRPQQEGTPA